MGASTAAGGGPELDRNKSKVLFPGGVEVMDLTAHRRAELEQMQLTVAGRDNMRAAEAPIGTDGC